MLTRIDEATGAKNAVLVEQHRMRKPADLSDALVQNADLPYQGKHDANERKQQHP